MANPVTEIILSAKDRTQQAFDAVEKRFSSLSAKGGVLSSTLSGIASAMTVGAFTAWTKSAIDAMDAMNDLSVRTGIAVDELSGWQYAVELSDSSMEALSGALSKATKYMVENGDALKKLGIEANNATDVIVGLADVISSLPDDDPRRLAVGMQVLGKSAVELMPLLSGGSDEIRNMLERGRELNTVTQDMANQASLFNDRLDEMKIAAQGGANALTAELLPAVNQIMGRFLEVNRSEGFFSGAWEGYKEYVKVLFNGTEHAQNLSRIDELQTKLAGFGERLEKIKRSGANPALTDLITRRAKEAADELAKLSAEMNPIPDYKAPNKGVDAFLAAEKKSGKEAIDQGQKYLDQLKERLALIGKVGEAEQLVAKIQAGSMKFSSAAQAEQALSLAEQLDLAQKQIEITKQQETAAASAATQFEALNARLFPDDAKAIEHNEQLQLLYMTLDQNPTRLAEAVERLNKAFYGDQLGDLMKKRSEEFSALTDRLFPERSKSIQYYADLKLIEDQLAAMNITAKEASEATRRLTNEFEKSSDQMSQFAIQAARNIQTTLGDTLYEGLNGRFDSIGESFNRMLTRMMADLAASQLADSLFGSFGTSGKMGGLVGALFGSAGSGGSNASPGIVLNANGGVYDSPSLSQYSNSIVDSPTMFAFAKGAGLMGEAGPEAIMPLSRDSSGRLGVVVAGTDRPAINVQVNIVGASSQPRVETSMGADGSLTMDIIFEQVESFLNRRVSRGQGLAETLENKYGLNPAAGANG